MKYSHVRLRLVIRENNTLRYAQKLLPKPGIDIILPKNWSMEIVGESPEALRRFAQRLFQELNEAADIYEQKIEGDKKAEGVDYIPDLIEGNHLDVPAGVKPPRWEEDTLVDPDLEGIQVGLQRIEGEG